MALLVTAAGLIRAGHHPVDIIWIGITPQGFVLGDCGLRGIVIVLVTGAAGTFVPVVNRSLHSFRGLCHGAGIFKNAGADIVGVASSVEVVIGIAIIIETVRITCGQPLGDRLVKRRFEGRIVYAVAVVLLNEGRQILPRCRCGIISDRFYRNIFEQQIPDKQSGAVSKVRTIRVEIRNAVDDISIGDGRGISCKCRCGQQAQYHDESKQAAE